MTKSAGLSMEQINTDVELYHFTLYQQEALKSAIFPEEYKIIYPALGLAGETGEVVEKVKKLLRGDVKLDDAYRDMLIKELGDVLWYMAALANDLDTDLEEVAKINLVKLKDRQGRNKIQGNGDSR